MKVANEIRNQIGNKALMMIGAKNLGATENSLSFKVGRNSKKVTHIKIELNVMDTYTMTFFNIRGTNFKTVNKMEGVYCDMIHKAIEDNTGMCTSLGTMGR